MKSVQMMRWTLVNTAALVAVVSMILGQYQAGGVLGVGVAAHTAHWLIGRRNAVAQNDGERSTVQPERG